MRDLKVTEWHRMALMSDEITELGLRAIDGRIKTWQIAEVAAVFHENSLRVFQMSSLLTNVFFGGKLFQMAETNAFLEVTGSPFPQPDAQGKIGSMPAEVIAKRDEYFRRTIPMPHGLLGQATPEYALQDCASYDSDGVVELLMSMQVVAAWSAFEALSGDLWEAAVNASPNKLAGNKESERLVKLSEIQKLKYDLRDLMGTLLRETLNFTVLEGIRDAYKSAFKKHADTIHGILNDPSFTALSLLRNVIAHHAGVCDKKYAAGSKDLNKYVPVLDVGQKLELDGGILIEFLPHALGCCVKLITSVDEWICNHQKINAK